MNFETCILRFRDLGRPSGSTINSHKEIIKENGCVWWGWWNKTCEKIPDYFSLLRTAARNKQVYVYLLDSGCKKLYKAKCVDLEINDTKQPAPNNGEYTPEYYRDLDLFVWFKLESITASNTVGPDKFTNIEDDSLFIKKKNYDRFDGKKISSFEELIQQDRTVWFVRNYKEGDRKEEIILLDSAYVQPSNFSEKYYQASGSSLLWLSDLHLSDNVFPSDGLQKKSLFSHIDDRLTKVGEENIAGLLISGDITSRGETEGFTRAKKLITDIKGKIELSSENIVICPGNHDFKRSEETLPAPKSENKKRKTKKSPDAAPLKYYDKSLCKDYADFYEDQFQIRPNDFFSCGKKILLSSGHLVEIVALNSIRLQQYQNFDGFGFISTEQLEHAAREMSWENTCPKNIIRIVMMHHHYLPVCFNESIEPFKSNTAAIYDADELMRWLVKHDVKLLLHGHKHTRHVSRLLYPADDHGSEINVESLKQITIVGISGTAAKGDGADKLIGLIRFEDSKIRIEFFKMDPEKGNPDKPDQTIIIPI